MEIETKKNKSFGEFENKNVDYLSLPRRLHFNRKRMAEAITICSVGESIRFWEVTRGYIRARFGLDSG